MKIINELYQTFKKPSAALLAQSELEDAQRELLVSETALDHARASVNYNRERVQRLTLYVRAGATRPDILVPPPLASRPSDRADIAPMHHTASPTR